MVHHSMLNMEERIGALEGKDILTDSHKQSVMRISKVLETMCSEFKAYRYKIVGGLESDKKSREQVVFHEHQKEDHGIYPPLRGPPS